MRGNALHSSRGGGKWAIGNQNVKRGILTAAREALEKLREPWRETFGEEMPVGFEVTPSQIGLIRKRLKEKSRAPLDAHIDEITREGRVY